MYGIGLAREERIVPKAPSPIKIEFGGESATLHENRHSPFRVYYEEVAKLSEALSRVKASKQYLAYLKKQGLA
jgi:hypothetical protein